MLTTDPQVNEVNNFSLNVDQCFEYADMIPGEYDGKAGQYHDDNDRVDDDVSMMTEQVKVSRLWIHLPPSTRNRGDDVDDRDDKSSSLPTSDSSSMIIIIIQNWIQEISYRY